MAGLLVRSMEPDGNIVKTTYDGFGRPVETTVSATGLHTTMAYDPVHGQVVTQQSWSGAATYAAAADKTETVHTYYAKTEATPWKLKTSTVDGVATNFRIQNFAKNSRNNLLNAIA